MKFSNKRQGLALLMVASMGVSLLAGCSQNPVKQDYNSQANFQAMKSIHWLPANQEKNPLIAQFRQSNAVMASRVHNAIAETLKEQSIAVGKDPANGYVTFYLNHKRSMVPDPLTVQYGFGGLFRHGSVWFETAPEYTEEISSTLVIEISNPNYEVIWQAKAPFAIDSKLSPQEKDQEVKAIIAKMLRNFPPKSGNS